MKKQFVSRLSMLLLLGAPLNSLAHDSLEAMQHGGSLMKLTAALLHPLLETPYWPFLLLAVLVVMALAGAIKHKLRPANHAGFDMRAQPVRVDDHRHPN